MVYFGNQTHSATLDLEDEHFCLSSKIKSAQNYHWYLETRKQVAAELGQAQYNWNWAKWQFENY